MGDIVYVDEEEGKKRLMNNAKLYAKVLAKFKSDTSLADFVAAAGDQDWEKAQAAAHAIKGVAANLSLIELARQSLDVENQVKGNALSPDSLESLKACYAETILQVDKVIAQYA